MENPYQAPHEEFTTKFEGEVGPDTIRVLNQTRPWVFMMAILCAIGTGFMALGGFALIVMAAARSGSGPTLGILGAAYLLFSLLYGIPALFLFKYAIGIGRLISDRSTASLNDALRSQKSFWKFIGVATILFVLIYILAIVIVVLLGTGIPNQL